MNMRTQLKAKNIIIYIISLILTLLLIPQHSSANRVTHPKESIDVVCEDECTDTDRTLAVRNVSGNIQFSVESKSFEMRRSDNGNNLVQNASVPIGSTMTLTTDNTKPSKGTWFFSGGVQDSPDMNNVWYAYEIRKSGNWKKFEFKGEIPPNNNPSSIIGSGAVSCSGNVCTANAVGSATIRVKFPSDTATFKSREFNNNNTKDKVNLKYSSAEHTYSFSVYNPNSAPTVSCIAPFDISYTTAEARWSYSDADGDAQTNVNIQVATNSNFTTNSIVADFNASGNGTTRTIGNGNLNSGNPPLSENTTYYTRVRVKNAVNTDWTGFSTCPGSFTTLINNPATVNLTSVAPAASDPDKYTRAVINWTYTDPENDPQTKAEIAISTNSNFPNNANTTTYLSNGAGLSYTTALASLLPGETYYVKIRAENEPNGRSEWSNSISVTMPNYPDPEFDFKLTGDGKTVNYDDSDKTLVLKTGDRVNASWSINNGTEVGLELCTLSTTSTTGGGNLASSITGQPGETDFKNSLSFTGPGDGLPSRNINGVQVPTITADRTYDVTLNCTGKPAKTVRSVNQAINLTVESYPIITSCSVDGNSTVQAGQTDVNIKATVGNVSSYEFKIGRKNGDNDPLTDNTSTPNLNRTLSYAGIEFGRHTPWLEVTRLPITNPERTVRDTCGTVANLGDSNIKEVR